MKPDYLILLNHTHRLPEGFENAITLVEAENVNGEKYRVEEKAYKAFLALREDLMVNDGLQIELLSVYRDIPQQERTWARTMESKGEEYTRKYVAIPGCSEHHTGFALDVGFALNGKASHKNADLFSYEDMYQVVHKKMPKYGFILRYPAVKEPITKISYEPWHFRYIDDPALAQEITDKGICFEEYHQEAKK
jgi:D-alanyl-D-alanine carboxypeptidase